MLQLTRYKNVLFTALVQLLVYGGIILPTVQSYQLDDKLPLSVLLCIVVATALIAAGGYVINDYFDVKIDRINKPDKVVIGSSVDKATAMKLYQALTAGGVVLGVLGSIALKVWTLAFVFVVVPGALWFYSASYKRQLIIGNLIVALVSGLVPLTPLIAMHKVLTTNWGDIINGTPLMRSLYLWVGGISLFAFLWTFIREIIKDLQDEPGDREYECHTMAIVWGEIATRWIVIILTALTAALVIFAGYHAKVGTNDVITLKYAIWGIALPAVCLIGIMVYNDCQAYKNASTLCKFIMLIGVLYCLVYNYYMYVSYDVAILGLFKLA